MKNLDKLDTHVVVASTLYYEKQDFEKFVELFSRLNIIDFRLSNYFDIVTALLANGSFDKLPENPERRRKKVTSLIKARIECMVDSVAREKVLSWFEKASKADCDLELQDELLFRYCWAEFLDRVLLEDSDDTPFKDKLALRPIVPDIEEKRIVSLAEVEIPEYDEQQSTQVFPTGIRGLDEMVTMRRTNFVVIAARTTIGKSLFMINQAIYNAAQGTKVLYASLEESPVELKKRVLLHLGKDKKKSETVLKNFIIFTPDNSSPNSVLTEILKYVQDNNIHVVFIDYIQLMKYPKMSDWDSLRTLTRELKLFAIKNNLLLVTASQLKREVEYTGSNLASLYGSSTLEADANTILILEPVRKQNIRINNTTAINIVVAKNRSGAQGRVEDIIVDYSCGHILEGAA